MFFIIIILLLPLWVHVFLCSVILLKEKHLGFTCLAIFRFYFGFSQNQCACQAATTYIPPAHHPQHTQFWLLYVFAWRHTKPQARAALAKGESAEEHCTETCANSNVIGSTFWPTVGPLHITGALICRRLSHSRLETPTCRRFSSLRRIVRMLINHPSPPRESPPHPIPLQLQEDRRPGYQSAPRRPTPS